MGARHGHFRYESGHHGSLWLDLDRLFLRPALIRPYYERLAAALAPYRPDVLCGPLTGGAYVAQAVAALTGAEATHTTAGRYELPPTVAATLPGRRVAVVDDVINDGSATGATLTALRAAGAVPVAVAAFLILGTAYRPDLPAVALERHPHDLWAAPTCPHCQAGIPLTP
jgi:orotate phosphoribosyltransferase